jgi:hypothetical protein
MVGAIIAIVSGAAVDSSVAVGIGRRAAVKVALTAMEARITASDVRRTRKVSGPRTRRTAGTRGTGKTPGRTRRCAAGGRGRTRDWLRERGI